VEGENSTSGPQPITNQITPEIPTYIPFLIAMPTPVEKYPGFSRHSGQTKLIPILVALA
jgi:hypothetical protein